MIRATLILGLTWCASRLLRNRPAAERHLLWLAAIGFASVLPWIASITPGWNPGIVQRIAQVLPDISGAASTGPSAGGAIVHAVGIEADRPVMLLLLMVWVAGSVISISLMLRGLSGVKRLMADSEALSSPEWCALSRELAHELGVQRSVVVLRSRGDAVPLTWGAIRPEILLPKDALDWPEGRRFSVLAHELAHIRRRDWLWQMIAEIACALYWFNPLLRLARRQLRLESERAADDAVLRIGVEEKNYARHLLEVAQAAKRNRSSWSLAMAGQPDLEKRLVAILNSRSDRRGLTRPAGLVIVTALVLAVAPVAAMRVSDPLMLRNSSSRTGLPSGPPQVLHYALPPLYSSEARAEKVEGVVVVEGHIDATGQAHDLRIVQGLGYGLDENALLAVRSWRFTPGGDTPETATVRLEVEFDLRNAELNDLIANDMVTMAGPDVVPPRVLHRVEAQYPALADRSAISYRNDPSVLLDAVIEEDGVPRVVRVLRSVSWELDEAAISALEQWRFSPAEKNGVPVRVRMDVEMVFLPTVNR